jgi:hypothetical protein
MNSTVGTICYLAPCPSRGISFKHTVKIYMMSEKIMERNSFRHPSVVNANCDILTVEMVHYHKQRLTEEGSISFNLRFLNW